ncbi:UDP-N-acetylglucosamine-1-phosphate transferase [Candidatus Nitrosocosmicus sp. SS]|jgi:UDP-N-acetylglucosamine--dolichyl-phosphate N-acetylglucosaminephosphotransferase|nr:UDP-N-acetylglucosamine-1-phosphate transferase [Candidatus Nitrosocosmicus sp. SS]KAF0869202.1 UDP-N-acetylglucosamine-1-phosphate transferase [Candidatus Nitrosocosmicus sp. SS]
MPKFISFLKSKGKVVNDNHKPNKPKVPRPAGPILLLSIIIGELILYFITGNLEIISILITTSIAFVIGIIDDFKIMPGWFKPAALIIASIPLILFHIYDNELNVIFGSVFIPILYIPLILISIPLAGNTINSIDVFNGVATGFLIITMFPIVISTFLFGDLEILMFEMPFIAALLGFYLFHRYPSRIFPGDSGTLLMGAMYGALAIASKSEIIAIIALLPAIMNSFLFLISVRKIVEHRQLKSRPTILNEDFTLEASKDKYAPITLVRLILLDGKLSENQIVMKIYKLVTFSSSIALITILIQWILTTK